MCREERDFPSPVATRGAGSLGGGLALVALALSPYHSLSIIGCTNQWGYATNYFIHNYSASLTKHLMHCNFVVNNFHVYLPAVVALVQVLCGCSILLITCGCATNCNISRMCQYTLERSIL
jgi:hypothetical protein